MLRPGWFSLRVLAVTAVSFGVLAPASFAQAVSLDGESLESTLTVPGQQTTFDNFTCDKAGTTTVNFTSEGRRSAPTSARSSRRAASRSARRPTRASTPAASVRSPPSRPRSRSTARSPREPSPGTKQLHRRLPPPDPCRVRQLRPQRPRHPNDVVAAVSDPNLVYSAQINATTGSRADSGTSGCRDPLDAADSRADHLPGGLQLHPCEDGNNGQGQGQGHPKPERQRRRRGLPLLVRPRSWRALERLGHALGVRARAHLEHERRAPDRHGDRLARGEALHLDRVDLAQRCRAHEPPRPCRPFPSRSERRPSATGGAAE